MRKNIFKAITLFFLLTGCASLTDQGREALAKGEVENALSLFQRATKANATDGEALEGLRKAQQAWIERKLIDVRLFRLANNFGESENLLLKLIQNENEWQVFPSQVAFATQTEEINYFAGRTRSRIKGFIEKKNPLGAQSEFLRNRFILEKAMSANVSALENSIYDAGKSFCVESEKSLKDYEFYTHKWLVQSCKVWKYPVKDRKLKNSVALFADLKTNSKVENLSLELTNSLDQNIRTAFLKSKWHDPAGVSILTAGVVGEFKSKTLESEVRRSAPYTVQVAYEEESIRAVQPKENSNGGLIAVLGLLFGSSANERVVPNGNGTEKVYTTRYRPEIRYHYYDAVETKSLKVLDGKLHTSLNNQKIISTIAGDYKSIQDKHSENFPEAGLKPANPQFITDQEWITSMGGIWIQKLTAELQNYWLHNFCNELIANKSFSEREQMNRCAYQVTFATPEPLKQYYLKNWEIPFDSWQQLIQSN